ncbi:hypothetical protein BDW22DRAFT_1426229 [Trametopsis cervina]|nr:hypothetical protein BDW22DRAFT_1426229 [Trametopsis cervina]
MVVYVATTHRPRAYEVEDITRIILDNLYADKKSLASCSLVCTKWTFTARLHLFASIRLHSGRSKQFLAFLHSPEASNITKHIRALRWAEPEDGALDLSDLCQITACLPDVFTLHLSFRRFSTRPTAFPRQHASASFAHIRRLTMQCNIRLNRQQNNIQPLMEFLTMFNLDVLEFDTPRLSSERGAIDTYRVSCFPAPVNPLQVRQLRVKNGDSSYHEADILSRAFGPSTTLQSIVYKCRTSSDINAFGRLLSSSCSKLRDIHLAFDPPAGSEIVSSEDWRKLNLRHCTSLETLSLSTFWNYPHHITSLFESLACSVPTLRQISLGLSKTAGISPTVPWALAQKYLVSLCQIEIVHVDFGGIPPDEQRFLRVQIERNWQLLARSGRLAF